MLGAPVVELHTGTWCNAVEAGDEVRAGHELDRLRAGAKWAAELGLEAHAGHGLNFDTSETLAAVPWFLRVQHRSFPDRRGDLRRIAREHPPGSRRHGGGPRESRMIIGIGNDLCDIRRIEAALERFGDRFTHRCFNRRRAGQGRPPGRAGRHLCQAVRGEGGLLQGARHRHPRHPLAGDGGGQPAVRPADAATSPAWRRNGSTP